MSRSHRSGGGSELNSSQASVQGSGTVSDLHTEAMFLQRHTQKHLQNSLAVVDSGCILAT